MSNDKRQVTNECLCQRGARPQGWAPFVLRRRLQGLVWDKLGNPLDITRMFWYDIEHMFYTL
jgi:hypothetical protein